MKRTAFIAIMALFSTSTLLNAQQTKVQPEKGIGLPNRWKIEKLMTDTGIIDLTAYKMYAEFNLQKGKVSGQAGCNNFFGEVKAAQATKGIRSITMTNFATTRMACPNMHLESVVLLAMRQVNNYSLNAARLLLRENKKTRLVLRKMPSEAPMAAEQEVTDQPTSSAGSSLAGQYKFISMRSDSATIQLGGMKASINLDPTEGKAGGSAPCNSFGGSLSTQPTSAGKGAIKLDKFISTMMACENLPIEKEMLKSLEMVDNYEISGNKLVLKKDTEIVFELERAEEAPKKI